MNRDPKVNLNYIFQLNHINFINKIARQNKILIFVAFHVEER